ncbi:hypothetical protein AVEN_154265-1, partial [Araneus ventricosus]
MAAFANSRSFVFVILLLGVTGIDSVEKSKVKRGLYLDYYSNAEKGFQPLLNVIPSNEANDSSTHEDDTDQHSTDDNQIKQPIPKSSATTPKTTLKPSTALSSSTSSKATTPSPTSTVQSSTTSASSTTTSST